MNIFGHSLQQVTDFKNLINSDLRNIFKLSNYIQTLRNNIKQQYTTSVNKIYQSINKTK